jgi:hypothetical protein
MQLSPLRGLASRIFLMILFARTLTSFFCVGQVFRTTGNLPDAQQERISALQKYLDVLLLADGGQLLSSHEAVLKLFHHNDLARSFRGDTAGVATTVKHTRVAAAAAPAAVVRRGSNPALVVPKRLSGDVPKTAVATPAAATATAAKPSAGTSSARALPAATKIAVAAKTSSSVATAAKTPSKLGPAAVSTPSIAVKKEPVAPSTGGTRVLPKTVVSESSVLTFIHLG